MFSQYDKIPFKFLSFAFIINTMKLETSKRAAIDEIEYRAKFSMSLQIKKKTKLNLIQINNLKLKLTMELY